MIERIPASVFILTKNSSATIRRALESVAEFDDIVICDGGSDDDTIAIARTYGAKIFSQNPECLKDGRIDDYACARNECLVHTLYDWVLYIDSDEAATPELVEEIRDKVGGPPAVYEIAFELVLPDRVVRRSAALPSYQVRFFHKSTGARFIKRVHERIRYDESRFSPIRLNGRWRVIWDRTRMEEYWKKARYYLALENARHHELSAGGYIKFLLRNLARLMKRVAKVAFNIIAIPARERMPWALEMNALAYDLSLIAIVTRQYFSLWKH